MAVLSAVLAFLVVSVGEASAHSRNARATTLVRQSAAVSTPVARMDSVANTARPVRVIYPAVVVAR
jgi:hypothetical protein